MQQSSTNTKENDNGGTEMRKLGIFYKTIRAAARGMSDLKEVL